MTYKEHIKSFIEGLDWSKTDVELASETGLGRITIAKWRFAMSLARPEICVRRRSGRLNIDWEDVDWNKRNTELADELGCSIHTIYAKRSRLDKPSPKPSTKWETLDWTKRNTELAAELGCGAAWVSNHRSKLGKPKATKWSHIPWDTLDWNKSDQLLCGELGITINTIRKHRIRLGKAVGTVLRQKVSPEQIEQADWEHFTDMELSRQWHVTRERVRQIRLERKKPQCIFGHAPSESLELLRYINEHRAELQSKTLKEAARTLPEKLNYSTAKRLFRKCGLRFVRERINKYPIELMDWRLPNIILGMIWSFDSWKIALLRSNYLKQKPQWFAGGLFGTFFNDPVFLEVMNAEIEKAKADGIEVDRVKIENYLAERRRIYANKKVLFVK